LSIFFDLDNKVNTMKNFKLKTLVAALAVVGFASACDRNTTQRGAYVPPETPPIERSTTANGTTDPGALQSMEEPYARNATTSGDAVEFDHEETVQFTGTDLTDASEEKLEDLAEALDKDKPVAVIVALQESSADISNTETANSTSDIRTEQELNESRNNMANSNTQTTDTAVNNGAQGTNSAQGQVANGAEFAERVDRVREFLREQGVNVVQWQFEGTNQSQAISQQDVNQEDLQQIRIVITNSTDANTIGAL
jgi:hypothetical protein